MADGVHGALIRHVPKPVEAEHRKERGNVITLLLQTVVAIALAMLKIPVDVIRNHAQVDVTNEIDYFSSFDVTEINSALCATSKHIFPFFKVTVDQINFVVTTANVLMITGDAMILTIVLITVMNKIVVWFKYRNNH